MLRTVLLSRRRRGKPWGGERGAAVGSEQSREEQQVWECGVENGGGAVMGGLSGEQGESLLDGGFSNIVTP